MLPTTSLTLQLASIVSTMFDILDKFDFGDMVHILFSEG